MHIGFFSIQAYDIPFFDEANIEFGHQLTYLDSSLCQGTTILTQSFDAVCVFVHDELNRAVLTDLKENNIHLVALRCAGFNNVDIDAANELEINVVRVPRYSPYAVAEHAVGVMLALNRKIHRAYARVKESNFSLNGLLGFDMHGKTIGIIGTGYIGSVTAKILSGFGVKLLAYDIKPDQMCEKLSVQYVSLDELYAQSDIITLHCPLTPDTHHLINENSLNKMKDGIMLINTSRGAVIDTHATINALKSGKIGYLGLDVYEQEGDLFFRNLSDQVIQDDVFERLLTFPNVLVTGHQGFFTKEAMQNIATTTLDNISLCTSGCPTNNLVTKKLFLCQK